MLLGMCGRRTGTRRYLSCRGGPQSIGLLGLDSHSGGASGHSMQLRPSLISLRQHADLNKGVEEAQAKKQLPELEGLLGPIKEVRVPDRVIQVALHQVSLQALQHTTRQSCQQEVRLRQCGAAKGCCGTLLDMALRQAEA